MTTTTQDAALLVVYRATLHKIIDQAADYAGRDTRNRAAGQEPTPYDSGQSAGLEVAARHARRALQDAAAPIDAVGGVEDLLRDRLSLTVP
jgi:TRAP-type C4-dicarboxylate transport system substrate-binding protein